MRDEELEKQGEKVQNETALLTTCPSRRATAGCTAGRAAGCNLGKESLECPPGPSVSERSLLQKKRRASAPQKASVRRWRHSRRPESSLRTTAVTFSQKNPTVQPSSCNLVAYGLSGCTAGQAISDEKACSSDQIHIIF